MSFNKNLTMDASGLNPTGHTIFQDALGEREAFSVAPEAPGFYDPTYGFISPTSIDLNLPVPNEGTAVAQQQVQYNSTSGSNKQTSLPHSPMSMTGQELVRRVDQTQGNNPSLQQFSQAQSLPSAVGHTIQPGAFDQMNQFSNPAALNMIPYGQGQGFPTAPQFAEQLAFDFTQGLGQGFDTNMWSGLQAMPLNSQSQYQSYPQVQQQPSGQLNPYLNLTQPQASYQTSVTANPLWQNYGHQSQIQYPGQGLSAPASLMLAHNQNQSQGTPLSLPPVQEPMQSFSRPLNVTSGALAGPMSMPMASPQANMAVVTPQSSQVNGQHRDQGNGRAVPSITGGRRHRVIRNRVRGNGHANANANFNATSLGSDGERRKVGHHCCKECRKSKIKCVPVPGSPSCKKCSEKNKVCIYDGTDGRTNDTAMRQLDDCINKYTQIARELTAKIVCYRYEAFRQDLRIRSPTGARRRIAAVLSSWELSPPTPAGVPWKFTCLENMRITDPENKKLVDIKKHHLVVLEQCRRFTASLITTIQLVESDVDEEREMDSVYDILAEGGWDLPSADDYPAERCNDLIMAAYGSQEPVPKWNDEFHSGPQPTGEQMAAFEAANVRLQ